MISGEIAFRALWESLEGKRDPGTFKCEEAPFERLRSGMFSNTLSAVDRVVRLRHTLRFADLTLPASGLKRTLPLPTIPGWPDTQSCRRFGLRPRAGGVVEASDWRPEWLSNIPEFGVDATSMQASKRQWLNTPPVADPFVASSLGFGRYKGPGQALAVRCSLHLPAKKTLLVLLPTGEGKSLIFQAIAAAHPGATVGVVVPTIALAMDQAAAVENYPSLATGHPHAYIGGRNAENEVILSRIADGSQGLLFAAPEAMVQRLRRPLLDAARSGLLAALIIDEAHLVNAWGTDFRAHFQRLAALIAEIREISPPHQAPKIICLSATVTQESLDTIEKLFSPNEPISVIPSARLRPEPDIWVATTVQTELEQQRRVLDSLYHLPRPAILYVTKQEEAERWWTLLIEAGFRNFGMVHGSTDTRSREETVQAWRQGSLDLVVGTSAFGLGIDYQHVRAVVHACLPESLDRYYQEIGRSGRDNRASIAVLVPTASDFVVARRLAVKKIISINKGLARWSAMFHGSERDKNHPLRFLVDIAVSPAYEPDMKSDLNTDWNGRVLNLMSLSGFIRLTGLSFDQESNLTRIAVDILHDGHGQRECWESQVEPTRKGLLRGSLLGYHWMAELAADRCCPSVLFSQLYRLQHGGVTLQVLDACGGCSRCRKREEKSWYALWPNALPAPWPIGSISEEIRPLFEAGRCLVARDKDMLGSKREMRRLRETIQRLWQAGVRKCVVIGAVPDPLQEALCERPWCVVAAADDRVLGSNGLPPGPEIVWVAAGYEIHRHHLGPRGEGNERILVLSPLQKDLENPGSLLSERIPLLSFNTLHDRILQ